MKPSVRSMCVHASDALEVHPNKVSCVVLLPRLQIKLLAGYFTEAAAFENGNRSLETLKLDKKSGQEDCNDRCILDLSLVL